VTKEEFNKLRRNGVVRRWLLDIERLEPQPGVYCLRGYDVVRRREVIFDRVEDYERWKEENKSLMR